MFSFLVNLLYCLRICLCFYLRLSAYCDNGDNGGDCGDDFNGERVSYYDNVDIEDDGVPVFALSTNYPPNILL